MSADLAVLIDDPSAIERAADPGEFIIQACERAKAWLREVLDHGDISQIAELRSQAEAIRVYSMQKQLGRDAELSAAEIVRRAERGIGVAIRRGQQDGSVETVREARSRAGKSRAGNQNGFTGLLKPKPTDFVSSDDLSGNEAGIYHLTDGVSDEDFERGLAVARAEKKLSRANVVRRVRGAIGRQEDPAPLPDDRSAEAVMRRREIIRDLAGQGYSSRQISERTGTLAETIRAIAKEMGIAITADAVMAGQHHHDSNRIVKETVTALEGLAMGVGLVEPDDLDPAETASWAASLTDSIRVLNRLIKTLREAAQ